MIPSELKQEPIGEDSPRARPPVQEQFEPGAILVAEFEYIAQTAFQANEDRARVSSYYLTAVGSFIIGFLSFQFQIPRETCWAFSVLFIVLSLVGLLILLQLVRLRQAWFESVLAMNQIKEFYVQHFQENTNLGDAFRWRLTTVPAKFKPWSISFMLAAQIALLGGATLAAATIFAGLGLQDWWWKQAVGMGTAYFVLQLIAYWQIIQSKTKLERRERSASGRN